MPFLARMRLWFINALAAYRSAFAKSWRTHQRQILLVVYFLAPLAAVPQALFAPFLIVANPHSSPAARMLAALAVAVAWQAWFTAQRGFIRRPRDLPVLYVSMTHAERVICEAFRVVILAWPLYPISVLLALVDTDGLAPAAMGWMFAVVAWTSIVTHGVSSWVRRHVRRPRTTSSGVLLQQAAYDVFSWSQVSVSIRHLLALVALGATVAMSSVEGQQAWTPVFLAVGTFIGFLPLRGVVDRASARMQERAPFVSASHGAPYLAHARAWLAAAAFTVVACVLGLSPLTAGTTPAAPLLPLYAAGTSTLFVTARFFSTPRPLELIIMSIPTVITLATTHA